MDKISINGNAGSSALSPFVLGDAAKCTGCRACELACSAAHGNASTMTAGNISMPVIPRLFLTRKNGSCVPVQCRHCENAPCMRSCLTGAITRKNDTVFINERVCIGCHSCSIACPFGAIEICSQTEIDRFSSQDAPHAAPRLVFKCDRCINGRMPVCASVCPNGALRIVNVETEVQEKRELALNADWPIAGNNPPASTGGAL